MATLVNGRDNWSLSVMIHWVIRVNPTQPVGQGLPTLTMTVVQQGQVQQGQWHVNPTQPVGQGLPTLTNDSSPARTSPARIVARVVQQGQQYTSPTRESSHTCYRFHLRRTDVSRTQRFLFLPPTHTWGLGRDDRQLVSETSSAWG
jgi:hypothetical protein